MTAPSYLTARRARELRARAPWSPFAYHGRRLRSVVRQLVKDTTTGPVDVLDYGCADRPYRNELPPGSAYVGADLPGNGEADVQLRDEGTVPLPDGAFDVVLSTQVLEHVPDPMVYLDECWRVLKPDGSLILSTHGVMYYHRDPEDYWRWTPAGLRKVLEERGFEVDEMRGVLGLAAAAAQIFQDATHWKVPRRFRPIYTFLMQVFVALLDRGYSEELRLENSLTIAVRATRRAPDASAESARPLS